MCNKVSQQVRKMLGKKDEYEIGEKLICKKFFKKTYKDADGKTKARNINKHILVIVLNLAYSYLNIRFRLCL